MAIELLSDLCNIVLDEIDNMSRQKEEKRIVPTHVIDRELFDSLRSKYDMDVTDAKKALNALYKERKILVGRTISNMYIKLI